VVGSFELNARTVPLAVFRFLQVADVWQRFAWRAAKPTIRFQLELSAEDDLKDAAAGFSISFRLTLTLAALPSSITLLNWMCRTTLR
jgi:hypothetical protein